MKIITSPGSRRTRSAATLLVACCTRGGGAMTRRPGRPRRRGTDTARHRRVSETTAGDRRRRATGGDATAPVEALDLDTNGDGEVRHRRRHARPRDDGAYYQALVDGDRRVSSRQRIRGADHRRQHRPAQAETELAQPRPPERRHDRRRRRRDRRPARRRWPRSSATSSGTATAAPASREIAVWPRPATTRRRSATRPGTRPGCCCRTPTKTKVAIIGCCDLGFEKEALPGVRARSPGRRPGVHVDVHPDRRLQRRRRRDRGVQPGRRRGRRRGLPVPRWLARGRRGARQRGRRHHDVAPVRPTCASAATSTTRSPSSSTPATTSTTIFDADPRRRGSPRARPRVHRRRVRRRRRQVLRRHAGAGGRDGRGPAPRSPPASFDEQFGEIKAEAYGAG